MIMPSTSLAAEASPAALAAGFIDAWNRHDMSAFASLFADDAQFVNVVGMWWRNRDEIEAAHRHSHTTFFRDSRLEGELRSLKFLCGDVALLHVLWTLTGQIEPNGSVGQPRHGILMLVAAKGERGWLIHAAQNTDIVAGALTIAAAPQQGGAITPTGSAPPPPR